MDDVILNKCASIERSVARAREEWAKDPSSFATDLTRQDAAILNVQRACEAALDVGHHLIRVGRLGSPQSARGVFELLAQGGVISQDQAEALKKMVAFRKLAVHEYQRLQMPIVEAVIRDHLDDLLRYASTVLGRAGLA